MAREYKDYKNVNINFRNSNPFFACGDSMTHGIFHRRA
jgi:hypothetical protein